MGCEICCYSRYDDFSILPHRRAALPPDIPIDKARGFTAGLVKKPIYNCSWLGRDRRAYTLFGCQSAVSWDGREVNVTIMEAMQQLLSNLGVKVIDAEGIYDATLTIHVTGEA